MADVTIPSIRGGVVEKFLPGDRITCTVETSTGTVDGGKLVEARTGDRVVDIATADSVSVVGVALHDAEADEKVVVATEGVWLLKASGSISAGDRVRAATSGDVKSITVDVTATPTETTIESALTVLRGIVGIALADITSGQTGPVKLTL